MMMKRYDSFESVDADLKILELQKEIDKEKVILNYNIAKSELEISPKVILKNALDNLKTTATSKLAKKAFLAKVVGKFFRSKF